MSKKVIVGAGAALAVLLVAIASWFIFAKAQPTEAEVRAAIQSALPQGAVIDQMSFAVFPVDRDSGRVSVKGTYSIGEDIYSLPSPPLKLMKSLAESRIFENDVEVWWSENSIYYSQFNGKLGEYRRVYSSGQLMDYSGELPYLAVVDGMKIDSSGLDFIRVDGTLKPAFGYIDEAAQVAELSGAIVQWRDRRTAEAAAAEAERVAKAEAAAAAAAKKAAERAAAEAAAAAAAAAAQQAAYEEVLRLVGSRGWSGPVTQPSSSGAYSMEIDVESSQIVVSYPELGCSGVWSFKGQVGNSFQFIESILTGLGRCSDNGKVSVFSAGDNLLKYEWRRTAGAAPNSWAVLTPRN